MSFQKKNMLCGLDKYSAPSNFSDSSVSCQWSVVKLADEGLVIYVANLSSLTC